MWIQGIISDQIWWTFYFTGMLKEPYNHIHAQSQTTLVNCIIFLYIHIYLSIWKTKYIHKHKMNQCDFEWMFGTLARRFLKHMVCWVLRPGAVRAYLLDFNYSNELIRLILGLKGHSSVSWVQRNYLRWLSFRFISPSIDVFPLTNHIAEKIAHLLHDAYVSV